MARKATLAPAPVETGDSALPLGPDGMPNRIRALRKERGWSLENLGLEVGCSLMQVSDLEYGKIKLSQGWMVRFARALGVLPSELLLPEQQAAPLSVEEMALVDRYRRATPDQRAQLAQMAAVIVPDEKARRVA